MLWSGRRRLSLAGTLTAADGMELSNHGDSTPDVAVKAALLCDCARFTVWPALTTGAPILVCSVGNDAIANAITEAVRGHVIVGRALEGARPGEIATLRLRHLLFIADAEAGRAGSSTFISIDLFLEGGRMRFVIDLDAAERRRLHLSSRLLGPARIIRNGDGH